MRLPSYLCRSRHGVFYFRYPIPEDCHPLKKRTLVKVSLRTRDPEEAQRIARLLGLAGQSVFAHPKVRTMRYDEIRLHVREHFSSLLETFQRRTASDGPASGIDLTALRNGRGLAEDTTDNWAVSTHLEGAQGLVRDFCDARGIAEDLSERDRELLLLELHKGYREYIEEALRHTAALDTVGISNASAHRSRQDDLRDLKGQTVPASAPDTSQGVDVLPLPKVLERYFSEQRDTQELAQKTLTEKRDALALMAELTGNKPPALMTKTDAREIKSALLRLPKNRNKNPKTRNVPLSAVLDMPGLDRIAGRTVNVYLGHMQHFFGWAANNGYANENLFLWMRVKRTSKADTGSTGRTAFSSDELRSMFMHLTDENSALVRKDVHKWPALISMFTGMRLNEVAQLELDDIIQRDDIWCINVTPDGDNNKRLKNASSRRLVPVQDRLIESGFLAFYEQQKESGYSRLFPSLGYSAQNGYGRNAGRWFNERFLKELGLGGQGLVFHCLRHTMVTRLAQAGVEEPKIKALLGHSQTGVTFGTYFKESYLPSQLKDAIEAFEFEA